MQSKLANLKTFMNEFEEMKKSNETCDEEECDQEVEDDGEEGEEEELKKENAAKKELIEIHKQKLLNAKEKLKELQNLISRLQVISDETGIEADFSVAEHKIDEQTNEYLKKFEIQQKEEKLDELNRNKQKLLELLSRKEQETGLVKNCANDGSYLNEIESTFKAAENGFDMLSVENFHDEPDERCHSPSDLLWSKMKKQLAMRENLRNQKSELEECIRDEYSKHDFGKSQMLESKHEDANEILSAYRGFLMRGAELDKKCQNDQERESERSEQNSEMNRKKRLSESTVSEWGDDDQESKVSETKPSANLDKLSDKIECILLNQQKMNEQIFSKFSELFEKKSVEQSSQSNQAQFQTQLHIQQLMFNLNTAYHEISTQRSEISRLNEQMTSVNKQLAELTRTKSVSNTIGINTEWEERNEPSRASIVAALPSYFYNRKKEQSNAEKNDYTDDFEELDDEEEKKNAKKNELRTESSLSSTSNPRSSLSSSTLSLRKSLMKHRTSQSSALYKSLTFDKMREQIYSEVAALISQNESRPFYLLNLFKELQFIKDKNARDQALKSIFNISNRQSNLKLSAIKKSHSNEDKTYASKRYESDRQNEADEESTPFESDSLSNTVIFVRNSPKARVDQRASHSSGSSIMGLEEEAPGADSQNIGAEVKKLISKIIVSVKNWENFDSDEESSSGSAERSKEKKSVFNSDYLDEVIEKVHQALGQSAKHSDYLNYYAAQLTCYLKDALAKYADKHLVDCMEDVLIEISDILYNELTFYSTLKTHKKMENLSNLSNSSSSLDSSSSAQFSDRIEQTEQNFKKCKYQSIELLKRLSNILNNKFGDLKTMKEKLMDEKLALEKNKLEDFKFDLKKEFQELSLMTDSDRLKEKYGASVVKYVNASEPDSSVCGEDNFQSFETDSERELPYRVVDADELKDNTITIDDLPGGNEEKSDETGNAMPGLDKIIMESICDQLVGNADEIIKIEQNEEEKDNKARRKTAEDNGSLNSDSSNSDHFVIITDSKKEDDEKEKIEGKCDESEETEPGNEQGSSHQKNTQ
ncbi:pericentriolar material 1 [Brachionus plicatilis]|uniref:Pericentriolar material 1 n=1 Tax=Brachionus plicatilis TaxID=10195 RepID=A0A3M7R9V2_BRAPC|nr:pericentriolar material 1 [Brachionus plicatilis]